MTCSQLCPSTDLPCTPCTSIMTSVHQHWLNMVNHGTRKTFAVLQAGVVKSHFLKRTKTLNIWWAGQVSIADSKTITQLYNNFSNVTVSLWAGQAEQILSFLQEVERNSTTALCIKMWFLCLCLCKLNFSALHYLHQTSAYVMQINHQAVFVLQ